ncbi:hypothetical protein FZW96_11970 [Bacillus sp. BGMRC 2118]|nr:hypothetical protein FZW96_11970 [Bacillus sp. BGMRC 2118]
MLDQYRKQNAERALQILEQGPIHRDDLTRQLQTSIIETGHALNLLSKVYPVRVKGEIIFIKEEKR